MAELQMLLDQEIPSGRQALLESHQNLQKVAFLLCSQIHWGKLDILVNYVKLLLCLQSKLLVGNWVISDWYSDSDTRTDIILEPEPGTVGANLWPTVWLWLW